MCWRFWKYFFFFIGRFRPFIEIKKMKTKSKHKMKRKRNKNVKSISASSSNNSSPFLSVLSERSDWFTRAVLGRVGDEAGHVTRVAELRTAFRAASVRGLIQRENLAWLVVVASEDVAEMSKLSLSDEASKWLHARPFVDFLVRDVVDLLDAEDYAQPVGAKPVNWGLHALGQCPGLAPVRQYREDSRLVDVDLKVDTDALVSPDSLQSPEGRPRLPSPAR